MHPQAHMLWKAPRWALAVLLAVLGMLVLIQAGQHGWLWAAVFLIGLGAGGETGTTQYFLTRYFGLRHFSVIYGSVQPFTFAIAISLGTYVLGVMYDRSGGYGLSSQVLLAAFSVATVLLLGLGRYRYTATGLSNKGATPP